MSTFGRYLRYRLKETTLRNIIFTVLCVLFTQKIMMEDYKFVVAYDFDPKYASCCLSSLTAIMCIFASIIPLLETRCFKSRSNIDTLYSFPIKRHKMALAHYISGIIQFTFIYTVTYFAAFAYLSAKAWYFDVAPMIPFFFLSLLFGYVIFSVSIFIFGQANTPVDGVIFSIMWIFAIGLVLASIEEVTGSYGLFDSEMGILFAPIITLTEIFTHKIEINSIDHDAEYVKALYEQTYWFAIWGVLGVGAAIGYVITFVKKGAQKIGEVSDSWFGYRTLIPIFGYSLLFMNGIISSIYTIVLFSMMLIGYVIYRRSFRLKIVDIIMIALGVVPLILGDFLTQYFH